MNPAPNLTGVCTESRWTWGPCRYDRLGICVLCRRSRADAPKIPPPIAVEPLAPILGALALWAVATVAIVVPVLAYLL